MATALEPPRQLVIIQTEPGKVLEDSQPLSRTVGRCVNAPQRVQAISTAALAPAKLNSSLQGRSDMDGSHDGHPQILDSAAGRSQRIGDRRRLSQHRSQEVFV